MSRNRGTHHQGEGHSLFHGDAGELVKNVEADIWLIISYFGIASSLSESAIVV